MTFALNVFVSALTISFASWLAGRFPVTAGFIVALPLATMLVLPLSYLEHGDPARSLMLAKSILLAVPVSLSFFVPFLLSGRIGLSFWQAYLLGCLVLSLGFLIHREVARALLANG